MKKSIFILAAVALLAMVSCNNKAKENQNQESAATVALSVDNILAEGDSLVGKTVDEATIQRMEEQYKNQSGEKHGDGEAGCESEKKAAGQADINTFEGRIQNFRERLAKAKEAGKDYFVMSYHINTTSYEIKN